jgi:iron complex transport system ATP-binding protein
VSLAVSNLSFGYNGRMVVDQVSFDLAPGRILAILGPNGVGKTTLLKCLNAILKPRGGTVLVEDIDVLGLSRREVARRFGYVPQRLEAGRLTVFDAVLLGRTPHLGLRPSVHDVAVAERVILRLGLAPLGLHHLDRLSGGELQKVAVARALAQEPRILLFDEPTASLDLKNQMDILGTIREVVAGQNVSAVLTMHDVSAALRFADACLLMKSGRVLAHVAADALSGETIGEVYGLPVRVETVYGQRVVIPCT